MNKDKQPVPSAFDDEEAMWKALGNNEHVSAAARKVRARYGAGATVLGLAAMYAIGPLGLIVSVPSAAYTLYQWHKMQSENDSGERYTQAANAVGRIKREN